MITPHYIRATLWFMLALIWMPTLAIASTVTLARTFDGISFSVVLIVMALSTLSGATALVVRIDRELRSAPDANLPRPALFASAHMLGSWLAGAFAFVACEGQGVNDWLELGVIIVASFTGAKAIEMVAEKWLSRLSPGGVT